MDNFDLMGFIDETVGKFRKENKKTMLERKRLAVDAYYYTEHGPKARRLGIVDMVGPNSIDAILKFLGYIPTTNDFGDRVYTKENDIFEIYPEDVLIEVLTDPYEELFGGKQ